MKLLLALPFAFPLWEIMLCLGLSEPLRNHILLQHDQWKGPVITVSAVHSFYHWYGPEVNAVELSLRGHGKIVYIYCHQPGCRCWGGEHQTQEHSRILLVPQQQWLLPWPFSCYQQIQPRETSPAFSCVQVSWAAFTVSHWKCFSK